MALAHSPIALSLWRHILAWEKYLTKFNNPRGFPVQSMTWLAARVTSQEAS